MEPTQTGLAIPLDAGFLSCHRCAKCVMKKFPYEYLLRYLRYRRYLRYVAWYKYLPVRYNKIKINK